MVPGPQPVPHLLNKGKKKEMRGGKEIIPQHRRKAKKGYKNGGQSLTSSIEVQYLLTLCGGQNGPPKMPTL